MPNLKVEGLPSTDAGRLLVRLNKKYRNGIKRYGIAKLTNTQNQKSLRVLMLGHKRDDAIFMPYDIRTGLGLERGEDLDFEIAKLDCYGKLRWYLHTPDPAVHIPAWLAVIALALTVAGLIFSLISLSC